MTSRQSSCFIGAYWGNRKESLSSCAARLEGFLAEISGISADFKPWFKKSHSKKETLNRSVAFSAQTLATELAKGSNKRDVDGSLIEDLGFRLDLWNGSDDSRSVGLNVLCGAAVDGINNACVLKYWQLGLEAAFPQTSKAVDIVTAMVRHWDPDWVTVTSYDVLQILEKDLGVVRRLLPGWIMYCADRVISGVKWPAVYSRARCLDRGELITLTERPISPEQHEGMARIASFAQFLQL